MIPMKKDQRLLVDDNKEGVNELTTSRKKSFFVERYNQNEGEGNETALD